ncbi:MAG: DUF4190 domain-containing protein [Polyangiaceae bacterium]|nr:DUF4190 domain-containing protein [Myxococcales bacterium]MCB9590268.1 DUF4190 domain-containing protein [Polyangiaceae bacterium]MCB9605077.1 DUF4190 domain-containing protein [Polyangiaceae bacterium]
MSQSPENPGGFKPPGAPPQQGAQPARDPNEPVGGFGLNLPPGVSTDVYQDQQARVEGTAGSGSSLAVMSLVFGILAMVLNFCCGLFGLVFGLAAIGSGVVVLNTKDARSGDRTMSIIGIVLGALSILIWVVLLILGFGMSMLKP